VKIWKRILLINLLVTIAVVSWEGITTRFITRDLIAFMVEKDYFDLIPTLYHIAIAFIAVWALAFIAWAVVYLGRPFTRKLRE